MIRSLGIVLQDPKHQFTQSPADYTLFHIGEYDDQDGMLTSSTPEAIINLLHLQTEIGDRLNAENAQRNESQLQPSTDGANTEE